MSSGVVTITFTFLKQIEKFLENHPNMDPVSLTSLPEHTSHGAQESITDWPRSEVEKMIADWKLSKGPVIPIKDAPMSRGNPPSRLAARNNAKTRIAMERERQVELWGEGTFEKDIRLAVLMEEVGEVGKAINEREGDKRLLEELVQVGATALKWAENLLLEMDR